MIKLHDKHFSRYIRTNLFSIDFLENHLADLEEFKNIEDDILKTKFQEVCEKYKESLKDLSEAQLEESFLRPVFKELGHIYEVQTSKKSEDEDEGTKLIDYAFFYTEEDKVTFHQNKNEKNSIKFSSCSTICEAKVWGLLEGYDQVKKNDNSDPIWQIKKSYLDNINPKEQKAKVPYGILTDGKYWRIYSYRSEIDKFFEINLEEIIKTKDLQQFKVFWFFFSREAFRGKSYLSIVESGSKKLQSEVSEDLRKQVYLSLELIATGLFRVYSSGKRDWDDFKKYSKVKNFLEQSELSEIDITDQKTENVILDIIFTESLVYLFRILFLLYADHRNLFKHRKVETVFYQLLDKIDSYNQIGNIPEGADNISDKNDDYDINGVFEEIDKEFNGGLFSLKLHNILNRFDIDNILYANAIDYLTRTYDKKIQKPQRVDFSVLEVRHLGTIYEGLLEYKLTKANEDTTIPLLSDKKKTRKLRKGDLYLVNDKGERKASGSYYTPDYIVETIVKFTVGPLVDAIGSEELTIKKKIDKILSLRILDPAMGSGHFLVEVISYLSDRIEALIQNELEAYSNKPGRKSKAQEELETLLKDAELGLFKRIIAKKCIYGVDKNPMAVELAKLSIWIYTLQRNRKLEFFDYNLRCGDSLIGSQEKTFSSQLESQSKERMLFGDNDELYKNVVEDFKEEFKKYFDLDSVEERMKYYESVIKPNQQKLKYLANIELALAFAEKTNEIHSIYDAHKNKLLNKLRIEKTNEYLKKLVNGKGLEDWEIKLFHAAKKVRAEYNPIHWELDFPNVFIDRGGFDAVVGNPPYVRGRAFSEYEKLYLKKLYSVAENQFDLFHLFIEKALHSAKKMGLLSFIVPNSFLANENSKNLRNYLLKTVDIKRIVECGPKVFEEANVESLIFLFEKGKITDSGEFYLLENKNFEYKHKFNTANFFNNTNYIFSVTLPMLSENISLKIKKISNKMSDFYDITTGIKEYQVGKGNPSQTKIDKDISRFNSNQMLNDTYKPELRGRNIQRYCINWENEYISYGEWLAEPRDPKFFSGEKILIRQIPGKGNLVVSFTEDYFIVDQTVFIGKQKVASILNNLYVLSLLNSKLIFWFFRNEFNEFDILFPKIKANEFKSLPIVNKPSSVQQPFIRLARIMLSENKKLREIQRKFTKLLQSDLKIEKLSDKLEEWNNLSFDEFLAELKKKKIQLNLEKKAEWMEFFEKEKAKATAIQVEISKTDSEIDSMVYKLYGLTEEEIRIVEEGI